jgi:MGT family glycosyltransferase
VAAGRTIAFFPEPAAIGPLMNSVGIAQGLAELGHRPVFLIDPGLEGTARRYGFEEVPVSCMEPMPPEKAARYWEDFVRSSLPAFRTSPYEQISSYVRACWQAIVETSRWSQSSLPEALARLKPDLIVNDNVALYPATEMAGCPWVRMISCSENEISDPDIPPHLSGCREGDRAGFEKFRARYEAVIRPIHEDFDAFVRSTGHDPLPWPEFVLPSPHLNLLLYPEPLRFARRRPLDPRRFHYLDGCVRRESVPYEVPGFGAHDALPLLYLSFGSLGVADVELIERMIDVLGRLPYRVLVNVGGYESRYSGVPENVRIAAWLPQSALIPHCDVVIQHGGNNTFNETLFYGKRPILMPFAWDGHDNAARVEDTRHGIRLPRYDWTDRQLAEAIERVLGDDEIAANLRRTSRLMQANDGRRKAARLIDDLLRERS